MQYFLMDLERTIINGIPSYWRKNNRGYTFDIEEAGLYDEKAAKTIVAHDRDKTTIMIELKTIEDILKWKIEKQ